MNIIIHTQNADVPPAIRDYTEKRLSHLSHYFDHIVDAEVHFTTQRGFKTAQVTVRASGHVIRAEERTTDLRASVDQVAEKLEKQIKHYKDILVQRERRPHRHRHLTVGTPGETKPVEAAEAAAEPAPETIVRRKQFSLEYMSPEDAAERMQMLGHSFYMFLNDDSEKINVVYERRNGGFGVLEPA
jgi:putative sigma-54 modulation protein